MKGSLTQWLRSNVLMALFFVMILVAFAFLVYAMIGNWNDTTDAESRADTAALSQQMAESHTDFKEHYNLQQKVIATQEALAASQRTIKDLSEHLFAESADKAKLVKRVEALVHITQQVQMGPTHIPYTPPPAGSSVDSIAVPQTFYLIDSVKFIAGIVLKDGVHIDSAGFAADDQYIRTSLVRTGFLNLGRQYRVDVLHSNPLFRTTGLSYARVPTHVSRWNRWMKPIGALILGAAGAYYIVK